MRVVRHNGYVKHRRRISRLLVLSGAIALFGAVAMTFTQTLILPAYGVLIFGFFAFNAGMQQITKWNRSPRPDELLDDAMRRLNDRYTLLHFVKLGNLVIEHLLVFPGGLLVITTREVQGKIEVKGDRWRKQGSRFLSIFGMGGPPLGNPGAENERDCTALEKYLDANELAGSDHVEGLVVFDNPKAELNVISSDRTVVTLNNLVEAIRAISSETVLSSQERDEIIAAFAQGDDVEGPISLPARAPRPRGARAA